MKYGIKVPRNSKEVLQFDRENGNYIRVNIILKELEVLMSMSVFKKLPSSLCNSMAKGYQFAPLRMILDVKVDLMRKSRLVNGGHVVDSYWQEVYASTTKSVSARILMIIATGNNL